LTLAEPIEVTLAVVEALERLGLRYLVGGSMASSVHGVPRATQDIDLLVELPGRSVDGLVSALEGAFYVDRDMILDAVRRAASFNVVHLRTMYKVDVFVADRSELVQGELERRQVVEVGDPPQPIFVASPEDIVLQKLLWYRAGGEVSDRQWRDLLGVMDVQGPRLDLAFLREWADRIGVTALLTRAFEEAGRGSR